MVGGLGGWEIILIAAAILALLIGPKKLPELAGALGESKKEFKKSMKEAEDMDVEDSDEDSEE
jgi:TatA/E family protein of Tat protein translocase